ncbi:hypothetical protein LTR70_005955 [Exophiala xenobiotica]|uniref:Uncharacterized protein n=1 Tax=Lithohypha guttulata TaxID=1690604 RepID=A0ABR0K6P0_9EURO|nr:hypothetical protein LTR24_006183 [Lithohypha guttulata]KAK5317215.1 hypothetical protein LTR70_005955 [Exophiala xenobiotica]
MRNYMTDLFGKQDVFSSFKQHGNNYHSLRNKKLSTMDPIHNQKGHANEADKLILRLKCRHVTMESLAQCQLPNEMAQQAFAILASRADQELADCFMALLLLEEDPTQRLQHLQSSPPPGQPPKTAQGFREFVRNTLGGLYDSGHHELANTLVHYFIGQPDSLDEHLELQEPPSDQRVPAPLITANGSITPYPQKAVSPTKELTWVDRYGLPVDSSFKGKKYKSDKEEAEAKKTILEHLFGNPIVRWNAEDHAAGLYGDPADLGVSGITTGWVVQRHSSPRAYQQKSETPGKASQQRINQYFPQARPSSHAHASRQHSLTNPDGTLPSYTTRQEPPPTTDYGVYPIAFDLEFARMDEMDAADARMDAVDAQLQSQVQSQAQAQAQSDINIDTPAPALPVLEGDDSWSNGIDDLIAHLNRGLPQDSDQRQIHRSSPESD